MSRPWKRHRVAKLRFNTYNERGQRKLKKIDVVVPLRISNERFGGGSRGSPAARQDGDDHVDDMALQLLPRPVNPWFQCL